MSIELVPLFGWGFLYSQAGLLLLDNVDAVLRLSVVPASATVTSKC